jgi:Tol biopolymer transport system component
VRLEPGSQLGRYIIQSRLGAGGMGQVYEALDQQLQRPVAIKILSQSGVDIETRRRFEREALAASQLNHPNIVTVYEIGRDNGIDFIAMECVRGDTLGHVIGNSGLPPRTAIQYASQIASALTAAHDAGLVHRDLKPGNIMVNERGLIKVLDFGLAKAAVKVPPAGVTELTTVEMPVTEEGKVLGTVSYMSPEQAEGKPLDARSDIFSFGSVFYEMLSGRRAFQEESKIGTLAAVLHKGPSRDLPASVPRALARIVTKCLEKKPADRWQHIGDVKLLLDDLTTEFDAPPDPALAASRTRKHVWPLVAVAGLAGALITGVAWRYFGAASSGKPAPEPVLRMLTAGSGLDAFPALSRDGKLLAFASDRARQGNLDIWLQQIGGRDPIRLTTDPADESDPDFSPDATRIAFRSEKDGGGIYTVPAFGGEPVLLVAGGRSPKFSPDGKTIAYWTGAGGIYQPGSAHVFAVDSGGGHPRAVHPQIASALYPIWSPQGDSLLVLARKDATAPLDWWVLPVEGGAPRQTGALARLQQQNIGRVRILPQLRPTALVWREDRVIFAASRGDVANLWEIGIDRQGKVFGDASPLTQSPGRHMEASWANTPEADRIAFTDEKLNFDVWAIPVEPERGVSRGDLLKLTDDPTSEWTPSITFDGSIIAYSTRIGSLSGIRLYDMASRRERTLTASTSVLGGLRISGDGKRVIYSNNDGDILAVAVAGGVSQKLCSKCGSLMGVAYDGSVVAYEPFEHEHLLMLDSDLKTTRLAEQPDAGVILSGGQFSRDRQWAAFHALRNATGTSQVWIVPAGAKRTVPQSEWIPVTSGDALERDPAWSPSASLLYYISDRDGFRCIWARRLDSSTKKPAGDAFPVRHFHGSRQSLSPFANMNYLCGLSAGGNWLVISLGERTANIWMRETPTPR